MKNIKTLLCFSLLCAATFVSCEKEPNPEPQNPDNKPSKSTVPVISSYSTKFDNKAVYDENLIIVGKNFAEKKSDNVVMFDTTKARVLSASTTELTVKRLTPYSRSRLMVRYQTKERYTTTPHVATRYCYSRMPRL